MKKFKKLSFIILFIVLNVVLNTRVFAATNTISVKSNSSVTVGNTISVTITVSSSEAIGAWDFNVSYDSSKLSLVSNSSLHIVGYGDGSSTSKSYTYSFKANKTGSAKVWIDSATYATFADSDNYSSVTKGSKTITVNAKSVSTVVSYSKDNFLSSLSVDEYELLPIFDKNTLEYTVNLPENTKLINIQGKLSDTKAKVTGLGEVTVTDGENNIEIKVTAENGNVKTYVIKANVQESDPIVVNVNGIDYTIVRKPDGVTIPSNYQETTATISGEEVLAFFGDITKYNLVALKDKSGNINLYIYNLNNNSYVLYQELKFNSINVYPLEIGSSNVKDGYELSKITINNVEVNCLKKNNNYPLIYGMNLDNGEIGFYSYDAKENTLQRFNDSEKDYLDKQVKLYFYTIVGVSSFAFFELLMMIVILVNKTKKVTKELDNTLAKAMQLNAMEIEAYKKKISEKSKKQIRKEKKEQKIKDKENAKKLKQDKKSKKKNEDMDL